jgi:hypothetical protein
VEVAALVSLPSVIWVRASLAVAMADELSSTAVVTESWTLPLHPVRTQGVRKARAARQAAISGLRAATRATPGTAARHFSTFASSLRAVPALVRSADCTGGPNLVA